MGDSQNWSSFDEPKAPVAKKTPAPKQEKKKADTSLVDSFRSMDLMFFRNRLIFGGLVGFCTGATFGGSTLPCSRAPRCCQLFTDETNAFVGCCCDG